LNGEVLPILRIVGNYLKDRILPTVIKLVAAFVVGYCWCIFLIALTIVCRHSGPLRDQLIFDLLTLQWSFYLPLGFAGIVGLVYYLVLKFIFRKFLFPLLKRRQ
jgi:hypothetical protein